MSLENSLELREIFETFHAHFKQIHNDQNKEHNSKQREKKQNLKEVNRYFHPIEVAARIANEQLQIIKSPYRFCIFKNEKDEVMIDIIKIDKNGTIEKEVIRNITHENFVTWIDDISKLEGLFFDMSA